MCESCVDKNETIVSLQHLILELRHEIVSLEFAYALLSLRHSQSSGRSLIGLKSSQK